MKAIKEETVKVKLELTAEEAQWLLGVMQNPLHCENPEDEDEHSKGMRKLFFNSLYSVSRRDK